MAVKFKLILFGLIVISSMVLYKLHKVSLFSKGKENDIKECDDVKKNSWTILMTVNAAYFDFFQNWLYFYNKLQLNYPAIVIAEDDIVFLRLRKMNQRENFTLVRSWRNSLSAAVVYGSSGFTTLVSGRPTYILRYLEKGAHILYVDTDSVWLQDPFPFFNGSFDIWAQRERYEHFSICSGFLAIKSNRKSIKLMRMWETSLRHHLAIDQNVLNNVYKKATVDLKLLDMNLFPSGKLYFDEFSDVQRNHVVVVHNNFIKGHGMKLKRFKKFKLWFANLLSE